jgi:hypothetical protein
METKTNLLDLKQKIIEKLVEQVIVEISTNPEERMILREEFLRKYRNQLKLEELMCQTPVKAS